ncbi:unnamed protein product, partial [Sphacelaria rigidula]
RLRVHLEQNELLLGKQYYLHCRRLTYEIVVTKRRLQELRRAQKTRWWVFLTNVVKVHNTVDRTLLWSVLASFGVPATVFAIIY